MSIELNREAFELARRLIREGRGVQDRAEAWTEHQPTPRRQDDFIRRHGFEEFGMGFVSDAVGSDQETLFIAGGPAPDPITMMSSSNNLGT